MLVLAYSFALFLLWVFIGLALLQIFSPKLGVLRSWLLAPGVGLAALSLALMALNQWGFPIATFARPLALACVVFAVAVLLWRRPVFPGFSGLLFFAAAAVSLVWTGWPALQVGFNWISYGNDDMANYCLAAQRFADHGFYHVPTMADLSGRDYSSYYFFMHVADMMRFGAEHLVAWSASLAGLKTTQAFMPAILALALTQLFAGAGLVLQAGRHRRRAIVTAWLLAVSPLFMLGTLYQLIAQVGGVALLLVTLALFTRIWGRVSRRTLFTYSALPSLTSAALCIFYPETTPFVVLSILVYGAIALWRRQLSPQVAIALTAYVLLGVVVLLRHNLISYISTLVKQATSAIQTADLSLSLFPYFLLPSGFANFFGWMPIARDFPEPVISLSIACGMLLAALVLWRTAREAKIPTPAAALLLVQVVFVVLLYRGANDFGLYKLAMWMQPALAAALAGLVLYTRHPVAMAVSVALFALSTAPTALSYTRSSQGLASGGLTELRFGSRLGMQIAAPANRDAQITAGIENVVAAKFAASALRGHQLALASREFFSPNTQINFRSPPRHVLFHPHYDQMAQALPLTLARNRTFLTTAMLWSTEFTQPVLPHGTDYYLFLANQLSLFNKFGQPSSLAEEIFVIEPAAAVRNRLIFVHSGRGNHYYLGERRRISFFQQEPDLFSPGQDFYGLGRFMLLRVENPSEEIYLRVAATRTLMPERPIWKPGAVVHAAQDKPLGAVGHGAFNLFVGPLRPQMFRGAAYLAIDFADTPKVIADPRPGLKALYNQHVPLDYRSLIGWARDVSVVSAEQYAKFKRSVRIARFPEDLARADTLEFSGLYEDGWISPESKFALGAAPPGSALHLQGFVPEIAESPLAPGTLYLTVEGREIKLSTAAGAFDWIIPLTQATGITRVGLRFSVTAKLPGADNRLTGAKLQVLEIIPQPKTETYAYGNVGARRLASFGIDQDGWMTRTAQIQVPAGAATQLVLRFEHPPRTGNGHPPIRLQFSDADLPVTVGADGVGRVHVPASAKSRILLIDSGAEVALPAPDTRHRASRLVQLEIVPTA